MMRDRYSSLINIFECPRKIDISDLQLNWHQVFKFCQEKSIYVQIDGTNAAMNRKSLLMKNDWKHDIF